MFLDSTVHNFRKFLFMKPLRRPADEVLEEMIEYVLPEFPANKAARLPSTSN